MRVVVLLVLVGCADPRQPVVPGPQRPRIVAHRGASAEAPENTLAAFRRAWALGAEGVELDVRVTRDGEVVVVHDDTTLRTAGLDRAVADQTLPQLRALDAGSWKAPAFAGERIPTLGEALATMPPGRAMFVEIKSGAETVPAVAAAIRAGRPSSATILLQAYDPDVLAALAAAVPDAPAYWTVDPPYAPGLVAEAASRGFAGLALDVRAVDDALLAAARAAGLLVDVWTLNETELMASWLARDVRWIETDWPDRAPVGGGGARR